MSIKRKIRARAKKRALRVRRKLKNRSDERPRVSVFRSLQHTYAQIIDDGLQKTLVSCSSLELKDAQGDKTVLARSVGVELAKRAQEKGITSAVFDRGQFLFHGRVKALAEGLKEGGVSV